ncbi:cytochrome P450 6k1-like [Diorhabda sublineata]|uniref:cytochrome P450 6k1-like n=1 Tax=Diorhabda sublineata TaxID=1163346 RepID=UPI0024E0BEA0|nr:cytochrome P450 6k1-like [Diorhabda sublineata]
MLSSTWIISLLILILTSIFGLYKYSTRHFDYWKKRGVYYKKPSPFFGNFYEVFTLQTTTFELLKKMYEETDEPYFGIFVFDKPILVLKCPKLIKDVLIKDFNVFSNRSITPSSHNLTTSNFIFMQKVPEWRTTKSKLSPFFTSSMMKNMFVTVDLVCKNFVKYLEKSHGIFDAKHIGSQFSLEVISRCFYGVDPLAFDEHVSSFRKHVEGIFEFSLRNIFIQSCHFYHHWLVDTLKLNFVAANTVTFFKNVFNSAMQARQNYKGKATNLIDVMNASKDDSELTNAFSNAIFFMVAGQETTSSLISYVLYELALNQDIQTTLRDEIENYVQEYGDLTFEEVKNLKYLNMVISEGLRKYPVLPFLDRTAMADYRLKGTDLVIEKGMTVYVSFYATHMNPQYYPDPEKFEPERFLDVDFNNEDGLKYFPFGDGPRTCTGKRLGLLMATMAIFYIVSKFKIEKCESTPVQMEFEPKSFVLHSKYGLAIKIIPIMLITSSWVLDLFVLVVISGISSYIYFTRNFNYWKKRKIYSPTPIPFFGNFFDSLSFRTTIHENVKKYYDSTEDPFFGLYILDEPVLVLKSPQLIKDVLIKDFTVFCDRRVSTPKHSDMVYSVFFLKYNLWKKVRSVLSPLFRTSVLKNNYFHLDDTKNLLIDFLHKNNGLIDARLIGGHFATELLARWFFRVNPHCFDGGESIFRRYIHKLFDFNFRNAVIQNLFFIKPSWVSFFRLDFVVDDAINTFKDVLMTSVAARKDQFNGNVQDLTDLGSKGVLEKEKTNNDNMVFDIAVSNTIFFLIAGQETSSTILAFTLYELAVNQNVQDKLRKEVEINLQKHGEFTQDGIKDNKYMEMCLNETMRKYPALPFLDRIPITDYKFNGTNFVVEKGTSVIIPFFALHRDENYYPNPDKYEPERFLNNNFNVDGLNFIPFGEGPRACLGKRLGMMALAIAMSNIIMKFKLEKCEGTPEKIEFEPKNFALISKVGLPIKITPID